MPYTSTLTSGIVIDGKQFPSTVQVTTDGVIKKEIPVPAAKSGQLTTRTDNDTGELTMLPGHGITTGALLDVYWSGGSRRGMTVGTVAGNAVPIDGGLGDNLPAGSTSMTAMVPREEEFVVTGNNVKSIGVYSGIPGTVVFAESDDSEIFAKSVGGGPNTNASFQWIDGVGVANPLDSAAVAKVFFSHGSTAGEFTMGAAVGFN